MVLGSPLPSLIEILVGQRHLEMCVRSLPSLTTLVGVYIHCTVMSTASGGLGRLNKLDLWDKRYYLLDMKDREKEKDQNKGPKKWGYGLLIDLNRGGEKEKFGSKRNKEVRHEIPNEQGGRNESQRDHYILTTQKCKKEGIEAFIFFLLHLLLPLAT